VIFNLKKNIFHFFL